MAIYDDAKPSDDNYWHKNSPLNPGQLKQSEENSSQVTNPDITQEGESLTGKAREEGSTTSDNTPSTPFSYTGNANTKLKINSKSFINKNKKLLALGGIGGFGMIAILLALFFIFNFFKLPDFAANVASWQFARITNQARTSMDNVLDEKLSEDAMPPDSEAQESFDTTYNGLSLFDSIKNLNPNTLIKNMGGEGLIDYNYTGTILKGQKLSSIKIYSNGPDNPPVELDIPSTWDKVFHPIQTLNTYKTASVSFNKAMDLYDPEAGVILRSLGVKGLLSDFGASLQGVAAQQFLGKDESDANTELAEQTADAVDSGANSSTINTELGDPDSNGKPTSQLGGAPAEAAEKTLEDVISNPNELSQIANDNTNTTGIPNQVDSVISKTMSPDTTALISEIQGFGSAALKYINPAYLVAVPVCTFYEGQK